MYLFTVAVFIMATLSFSTWPFLNIDINRYLNTTIRMLDHTDAMNAVVSPLLSWCVYLFALLGFSLLDAVRLTQVVSFAGLLFSCCILLKSQIDDRLARMLAMIFITLQILPFALFEATGDLIAAAVYSWFFILIVKPDFFRKIHWALLAGVVGALSYYGKAILLPMFLMHLGMAAIFHRVCFKISYGALAGKVVVILAVLCALLFPYLILFHEKYGVWDISLDLYFAQGVMEMADYTISAPLREIIKSWNDAHVMAHGASGISILLENFFFIARHLLGSIRDSLYFLLDELSLRFGTPGAVFFLLSFVFLAPFLHRKNRSPVAHNILFLALIAATFTLAYSSVWGARMRYYYPIVGVVNLLVFASVAALRPIKSELHEQQPGRFMVISYSGALLYVLVSLIAATTLTIRFRAQGEDARLLELFADKREFINIPGTITGSVNDMYVGLLSAHSRKELPAWILPNRQESPTVLYKKLKDWKVGPVFWKDRRYENLEAVPGLVKVGEYPYKDGVVYLYDASGLWSGENPPGMAQ